MFSFKVTTVGFVRRHPHQSGNGADWFRSHIES